MSLSDTALLGLYRTMCRIRAFEDAAEETSRGGVAAFGQTAGNALVRGPLHLSTGQEAVAAGFATAMRRDDMSFATYRGHNHMLLRGTSMAGILGECAQRSIGCCGGKGGSMHITDVTKGAMGS